MAGGGLVAVDGLEVSGQLAGGDADRGDRRRVVHPPRTDDADRAEITVAETVVGADDAGRAHRRLRVLVADPEEDGALRERGAEHLKYVGAGLQSPHKLVG